MTKVLNAFAISSELTKLIRDAKEKIVFVSTYVEAPSQLQQEIKAKSKTSTLSEIIIVYEKSEYKKSGLEWIKDIQNLKVFEKDILHAKYYLNEEKAIICSMNLCSYAKLSNIETGILITKTEDTEAYAQLICAINRIKLDSTLKTIDEL